MESGYLFPLSTRAHLLRLYFFVALKLLSTILDIDEFGEGRILMEGNRVAILGYGSIVQSCLKAADALREHDVNITIADARFCKPLDTELIRTLAKEHEILITVEEGSIGGFGSHELMEESQTHCSIGISGVRREYINAVSALRKIMLRAKDIGFVLRWVLLELFDRFYYSKELEKKCARLSPLP